MKSKMGRRCSVDGCEGRHHGHGFCQLHHGRWTKHGSTEKPVVSRRPAETRRCDLDGCDRIHQAKGYCRLHYQRINYRPQGRIRGGVEHNTVCMKRGGCDQPPEGGGVYCLHHFHTEIVMPGKRRRGEL